TRSYGDWSSDVCSSDLTGKASARHALQVERPSAPAENLHMIPASPDEQNRPLDHEDLILIDPWPHEDLIIGAGVLEGGARSCVEIGSASCRGTGQIAAD